MYEPLLLSEKTQAHLQAEIEQIKSTDKEGKVEYLQLLLQLLEKASKYGATVALELLNQEVQTVLNQFIPIQSAPSTKEALRMMDDLQELFLSPLVIALSHTCLLVARTERNRAEEYHFALVIQHLKQMQSSSQKPNTPETASKMPGSSYLDSFPPDTRDELLVIPPLDFVQMLDSSVNSVSTDPEELRAIGNQPGLRQHILPRLIGILTTQTSPEEYLATAHSLLGLFNEQTSPRLLAAAHYIRAMGFLANQLETSNDEKRQAIDDCNVALTFITRKNFAEMWAGLHLIRGIARNGLRTADNNFQQNIHSHMS